MIPIIISITSLLLVLLLFVGVMTEARNIRQFIQNRPILSPKVDIDMQPLHKHIDELPNKVLTSIQNSTNTYKGVLGELIGYINLRASYDRIIPLGSIVDFVCIRFPDKDHPGCVDFVDVKTGHKARLSKDQRTLQQLIKDKKINFCQLKIETSDADHSQ